MAPEPQGYTAFTRAIYPCWEWHGMAWPNFRCEQLISVPCRAMLGMVNPTVLHGMARNACVCVNT